MTILALEFSTERRSAAVLGAGGGQPSVAFSESRAVGPLTLVDQALSAAAIEREAVECIAVGVGPGSYTGIRSAIALAQGWELARGVRLLAVSSVDCLLHQAHAAGLRGRVQAVVDAQRNEFYLAAHHLTDGGVELVEPLRLAALAEVQALERKGACLIGPEVTRWFADGRAFVPDAATLAQLARPRTDFIAGEALEPIYLREVSFVKAPPPRIIV